MLIIEYNIEIGGGDHPDNPRFQRTINESELPFRCLSDTDIEIPLRGSTYIFHKVLVSPCEYIKTEIEIKDLLNKDDLTDAENKKLLELQDARFE